jgi:hypothetical protein
VLEADDAVDAVVALAVAWPVAAPVELVLLPKPSALSDWNSKCMKL